MRQVSIRFGASAWRAINSEASRDGITAAQFVREAAIARVVLHRVERGDDTLRAARKAWEMLFHDDNDVAQATHRAVDAVTEHGADLFNVLLERLDERDPAGAACVRDLYALNEGEFLKENP